MYQYIYVALHKFQEENYCTAQKVLLFASSDTRTPARLGAHRKALRINLSPLGTDTSRCSCLPRYPMISQLLTLERDYVYELDAVDS
jgi:hypothetical protein